MTSHIERAEFLLTNPVMTNPDGSKRTLQLSTSSIALAQAHATLALAKEQHAANLIACSQRVFIRDAPDAIREHFGEAPLGAPEFDQAAHLAEFQGHLRQGLEEYFGDEDNHSGFSIYADLEDGKVGVDGHLDLPNMARFLAGYLVGLRG
ncbi:hypothetical protein FDH86_gp043 [Arthrobacter phage Tank]|uniref:Uncharacterized protein n=2 Tax=Tankvirus tank TaxID=1982567 RepID=A0A0U4K263_9CAUD|nr:hypothetical protein FDH86_gp043 [Arthrobacter phage Tank]ALY10578.1 hypothetical protein TANK_43 [Arthrobacter phage Tank]ALY10827.1 hypothetical protein WILDE_43 [Arthrobacter phage Wilde]